MLFCKMLPCSLGMRSLFPAAVVVLACLCAVATPRPAAAQQDPFIIPLAAALLPWPANNSTQVFQAGSPVAELNLAKVFLVGSPGTGDPGTATTWGFCCSAHDHHQHHSAVRVHRIRAADLKAS